MGKFASAKELAEAALRRVGSYAPHDTAADPDHLSIALGSLDRNVKQLAGTIRAFWLVPVTALIPLPAATNPVDIVGTSAAVKSATFQFLVDAKISRTVDGVRSAERDLTILPLGEYNDIADKDTQGPPDSLYVDRLLTNPNFYIYPVAPDASYTLHLSWQTYAADQTANSGVGATGLDQAWERWAEYATAYDIGDGPVSHRPADQLTRWKREATIAKAELEHFHNRQFDDVPVTPYRDF